MLTLPVSAKGLQANIWLFCNVMLCQWKTENPSRHHTLLLWNVYPPSSNQKSSFNFHHLDALNEWCGNRRHISSESKIECYFILLFYNQKGIDTILHGFNFMMRLFPNKPNYRTNWRSCCRYKIKCNILARQLHCLSLQSTRNLLIDHLEAAGGGGGTAH